MTHLDNERSIIFNFNGKTETGIFKLDNLMLFFGIFRDCPLDVLRLEHVYLNISLEVFQSVYDLCVSLINNINVLKTIISEDMQKAMGYLKCDVIFDDNNHPRFYLKTQHIENCFIEKKDIDMLKMFHQKISRTYQTVYNKTYKIHFETFMKCCSSNWLIGIKYLKTNFNIVCACKKIIYKINTPMQNDKIFDKFIYCNNTGCLSYQDKQKMVYPVNAYEQHENTPYERHEDTLFDEQRMMPYQDACDRNYMRDNYHNAPSSRTRGRIYDMYRNNASDNASNIHKNIHNAYYNDLPPAQTNQNVFDIFNDNIKKLRQKENLNKLRQSMNKKQQQCSMDEFLY